MVSSVCLDVEGVFAVEVDVLLEGDVSDGVPVFHAISVCARVGEVREDVCLIAGATEVNAPIDAVVCYVSGEGARFLHVQLAIAKACISCGVITILPVCILPVFAEYAEISDRNRKASACDFITGEGVCLLVSGEFQIVQVQLGSGEVEVTFGKECILIFYTIGVIGLIEAAIAGSQIDAALMEHSLSSVIAVWEAVEPAALVADDNRLTAQSDCDSIAEVMIDEELIENDIRIIARLEIHFCIKAALYVGGIIDLSFYIQADTAVPLISGACVLVLVTHTAIAGEGKVSYLLFKIGDRKSVV